MKPMYWSLSAASIRGTSGWPYQDRYVTGILEATTQFVAVLDGHGYDNQAVDHCVRRLPNLLRDARRDRAEEQVRNAYRTLSEETVVFRSGTTLSIALLFGGTSPQATLACLGDSPVLWASRKRDGSYRRDILDTHDVQFVEKFLPEELARVAASGGRVEDGFLVSPDGARIAMTRALGDAEFKDVLGREPDVRTIYPKRGWHVMLSTDGFRVPSGKDWLDRAGTDSAVMLLHRARHVRAQLKDDATIVLCTLG